MCDASCSRPISCEDAWKFYLKELKSDGCMCGKMKQPGRSLCYGCYKKLPVEMQKALYRKIGSGCEEAYDAAHAWLTSEGEG